MHNTTHSVIEDIFALVSAGLFVAFGVFLFQSQDLMVGGAAGLALLGTYAVDMDFGLLFFLINPFSHNSTGKTKFNRTLQKPVWYRNLQFSGQHTQNYNLNERSIQNGKIIGWIRASSRAFFSC